MTLQDKASLRKIAFAARKSAHGQGLDQAANAALLKAAEALPNAQVIAGYMPIRTEVSPLATMAALSDAGKRICVPVITGEQQPLEFHEWTPTSDMVDGPFGAMVPRSGERLIPDVLIMPLVAFDKTGTRLGYGGGFYDRSLAQIAAKKQVRAVGFAYAAQELDVLPKEPTDWPLDAIVTEMGAVTF